MYVSSSFAYCYHLVNGITLSLPQSGPNMGLDPDSTYLIMSVWPIKNPCMALGAW